MRLFGGERMDRMFSTLGVDETVEISHPLLAKASKQHNVVLKA